MIRFIFRLIALICLAIACIMAILDISRSIPAQEIVLMPLGEAWFNFSSSSLNLVQAIVQRYIWAPLWDPAILWVLTLPAFIVFLVLALLFYMIGYKKHRPSSPLDIVE